MSSFEQFTRGDTFDFAGPLTLSVSGSEVGDLTGWTPRSMLRTLDGTFIAELTASWIDATQRIVRLYSNTTQNWPVGKAEMDIQLTNQVGERVSTKIMRLEILKDVTFDD